MNQQYTIDRMRRALGAGVILAGTAALAACGGGSSSDGSGTGSLSLGVTDAPVDSARNVFVEFSSVTLKPADGEPFTVELDEPKQIDLLAQQNGNSELLLENEQVTAGAYDWVRLGVDLDGSRDTYLVLDDGGEHELEIPSGSQTGLKLVSGFSVRDGGSLDLTIDFDLRKSVVESADEYKLKPALRLVNNDEAGEIAVTATDTYVSDNQCGSDPSRQAVYVFEGGDVTPDDVDGAEPDPVTTVQVRDEDADGTYAGTAGFLEAGTYTVAYTCDPEDDDPEAEDSLTFMDVVDIEVTAGETAEYKLPL